MVSESFILEDVDNPTSEDRSNIKLDAQAQDILCDCMTREEFGHINEMETCKEVWDVLSKVNEGVSSRRDTRIDVLRNRFNNSREKAQRMCKAPI